MTITPLATGWEFKQIVPPKVRLSDPRLQEWLPAQVPGHIHTDLMANSLIPDPFERAFEAGVQWVDEAEWSYRTTFTWSADEALPTRLLRFEGLDTICEIFLNGDKIASHDNMFVPLEVDVTNLLVEGVNTLQIDFKSAVIEGEARQSEYFTKYGMRWDMKNFEERAFVRKAQYMYGWDWGPRLVSCGIWKPIQLVEFAFRVTNAHIVTTPIDEEQWKVEITLETQGEAPQDGLMVAIAPEGDDEGEEGVAFAVAHTDGGVFKGEVIVEDPDLWWPNGLGEPCLYECTVFGGGDVLHQEMFGFRTIQLFREKDAQGEGFRFEVNGHPVWVVGANWIPNHSFPAIITGMELADRLESAVAMGMNMLRVWGGGLYESEEFYDLCDSLGLMVWQDFPYACSYYPEEPEHVAAAKVEATVNIRRLRNRASLALWCGNNENYQMAVDKWGGEEFNPPTHHGAKIYEHALQEACDENDPSRTYILGSPYGLDVDLALKTGEHPGHNMGYVGDSHYWDVWHGRGDWIYYTDSTARFSSEFGFASAPSMETIEQYIDPSHHYAFSPEMIWHDKTRKPLEVFKGMVALHYPEMRTIEDQVFYTQLNQRDAMRYGIEHWRRGELCKGTLIWQINDCYPVQSWALVDYLGNWKAAAHELVRVHQPTLISLLKKENVVELWAVNDDPFEEFECAVDLAAYDLTTGESSREVSFEATLDPGERVKLGEINIEGLPVDSTLIFAESEESDTWVLLGEPKNLTGLTAAPIDLAIIDSDTIQVRVNGPVVDLWLRDVENGAQLHPNFLTSVGADIWELETDRVPGRIFARSLAGEHFVRVSRTPLA